MHVEGHRRTEERVDNIRVVVQLLVDHKCEDSHLGSTTVVQFNCGFSSLLVLIPTLLLHFSNACGFNFRLCVISKSEVNSSDENDKLAESLLGDCVLAEETGEAVINGGKRSPEGNISREMDACCGSKVAEDSKHRDTSMLGLDVSQAVESLLVSVLEEVQRIPEAKRGLSTKGTFI